jgi:oligoendopeptidase F
MTWDLSSLFTNEEGWRDASRSLRDSFAALGEYRQSGVASPELLYHCLESYYTFHELLGRLETYAMLRGAEDTLDQRAQMMEDESTALRSDLDTLASFIEPAILQLGWGKVCTMLLTHPPLEKYRFYLESVERARPHTLSTEVEAALATMSLQDSTPSQVYRAATEKDLTFRSIEVNGESLPVNHGNVGAYRESTDPKVRRLAYDSYADGYLSVKHTVAATLVGQVQSSLAEARVQNFGSTFEKLLFEQNIPPEVYEAAVGACLENQDVFKRYFELRAERFEYRTMGEHDMFAPLATNPPSIPYGEGISMILESLSILGDRYVQTLRRGLLEERWADVEPREHKDSSQFSAGSYGTKPFLMTSYNGSVIDVSTLAHEAGHSVHTHLTNQSQPACYFDYVMIVAETASNLNQVLLREHIFAKGDRELSLAALDDAFCFMHRYLFLMPILSSIERRTHDEYAAGRSVSLDDLCGWTSESFTNGYGPAVNCDQVRIGIKWAEFSHLYEPGYPFQYIVGLSAALVLGKRLRAGEPGLPERIEEFLRAGASMPPSDIFKIVGIDISSPALYRAAFEEVKRLNQILESLITRP